MSEENLSRRALSIEPSLTLQISAKAKELEAKGRDICNLSAGEPDFEAPNEVLKATSDALSKGFTKYGPASGDIDLRKSITKKLQEKNNIDIGIDNVMITNGAKQAIYNLFQVLLNEGDEVIIPAPYWLSYPQIVKLAGGKPIVLKSNPENSFKIDIQELCSKISPRTKFIILNTPNNPTGKILEKKELMEIADIVRQNKNINILSDEIYECILEKGFIHYSLASIASDIKNRIFTINGFAKGWAMTGWRVGYLAGREDVIKASSSLQSQSTSNVCSFAQKGAIAALQMGPEYFEKINEIYDKRRNLLVNGLNKIKNISFSNPNGAFYAFPKLPNNSISSIDFCKKAIDDFGLVVVPGIVFGDDQCIRISCAASHQKIIDGIERLQKSIYKYYQL